MIKILRSLILKCVAQIGFVYQNLPCLWYWTKIALGRPVAKTLKSTDFSGKVAILAAFQKKPSLSFDLMLKELRSRGFNILLISNAALSEDFETWLTSRVDGLIVRDNIGRDLGAYKAGFLYLHDYGYLNQIDHLLFINDTILFPVIDADHFWSEIFSIDANAVGAFESFCSGYHLQSFFILLNKPLIESECLYEFWKNYQSWNSRKHAVYAGEIGFSKHLKARGVSMAAYVNAQESVDVLQAPLSNLPSLFGIVRRLINRQDVRDIMGKNVPNPSYQALAFSLERLNPSHALCEFALSELRVPILKKDLVYRGTLSLVDLVRIAENQDLKIPLPELQAVYRAKGLPAEIGAWKRFLLGSV